MTASFESSTNYPTKLRETWITTGGLEARMEEYIDLDIIRGYIRLPHGHPLHGLDVHEPSYYLRDRQPGPRTMKEILGVMYAGCYPNRHRDGWWISLGRRRVFHPDMHSACRFETDGIAILMRDKVLSKKDMLHHKAMCLLEGIE